MSLRETILTTLNKQFEAELKKYSITADEIINHLWSDVRTEMNNPLPRTIYLTKFCRFVPCSKTVRKIYSITKSPKLKDKCENFLINGLKIKPLFPERITEEDVFNFSNYQQYPN